MGTSHFTMLTSCVVLLLSVVFESSIADLPPPINIDQLDYAVGRKAEVPEMRDDDEPMECGTKKWLDCTDWENNYVLLETPGYPAKYQNKDKCIWKIGIPKESGTWIYCEEFSVNEGDYLFVGNQRYYGHKNYANIEPFQKSKQHTLRLKFKSNWRERNNGFKCWVTCWPTDPSQTPAWTSTTTTNGEDYWTTTTTTTTAGEDYWTTTTDSNYNWYDDTTSTASTTVEEFWNSYCVEPGHPCYYDEYAMQHGTWNCCDHSPCGYPDSFGTAYCPSSNDTTTTTGSSYETTTTGEDYWTTTTETIRK